jgi:ATP-dependent Clp protease ATP-binding subunit ClpA
VIQNELEDRLSEALLQERFNPGDTVVIDVQGEDLVMDKKAAEPAEPALT